MKLIFKLLISLFIITLWFFTVITVVSALTSWAEPIHPGFFVSTQGDSPKMRAELAECITKSIETSSPMRHVPWEKSLVDISIIYMKDTSGLQIVSEVISVTGGPILHQLVSFENQDEHRLQGNVCLSAVAATMHVIDDVVKQNRNKKGI